MNDCRQVGVAKIEDIGAGRVQEGGAQGIHALAPADDGRLLAIGKLGERLQCDLDRVVSAARERDREEVEQCALGLVTDGLGNVAPIRLDDEAGEVLRNAGSMEHGVGSKSVCGGADRMIHLAGQRFQVDAQLRLPACTSVPRPRRHCPLCVDDLAFLQICSRLSRRDRCRPRQAGSTPHRVR